MCVNSEIHERKNNLYVRKQYQQEVPEQFEP
jgi:hypothetical protein